MTQAEYLEAAAVCQDGVMPLHKVMQATKAGNQLRAGTQQQMIGVAQDNLSAERLQLCRCDRFDAGLCANRHIDWRRDVAVGRLNGSGASGGLRTARMDGESQGWRLDPCCSGLMVGGW